MEGHTGTWVHGTHAYPLLPQHGYAMLACLSIVQTPVSAWCRLSIVYPLLPLQVIPPTSPSVYTPYFLFGFDNFIMRYVPYYPFGFCTPYFSFGLILYYWYPIFTLHSHYIYNTHSCNYHSRNGGCSREIAYAMRCGLKHNDTNACVTYINKLYITLICR